MDLEIIETEQFLCHLHGAAIQKLRGHFHEREPHFWHHLHAARHAAADFAYAPYSKFRVGASVSALKAGEHRFFSGANVENASFGATICAERVAIFSAVTHGFRTFELLALSTLDSASEPDLSRRAPCGLCRQVMSEFFSPETIVLIDGGILPSGKNSVDIVIIDSLLPWRFELNWENI
jgi:cytidine deaminase